MADAQPAASSTAAETPETPVLPNLSELNPAQLADWRKTGNAPDAAADSSPAEPVAQAASTEVVTTPASEPGSPTKKKNAESRKQELQAEIDALLAKRSQLRAEVETPPAPPARVDAPQAVSSPASSFPDYDTWSTQQPAGKDTRYERYQAEFTLDVAAQEAKAHQTQQAERQARQEAADLMATYSQQAQAFVTEHPDYWSVVNPITSVPRTPTTDVIGEVIVRSEAPTKLLYHLGTHRDDFTRIASLPPARAIYELGKIDAALSSSPSVLPPQKTSAPPPPSTLSTRAVAPVDDVEAALASGDFRRYKAAQNARDVAAHR